MWRQTRQRQRFVPFLDFEPLLDQSEVVFNRNRDRYLWMSVGWDGERRVHGCMVHIDLMDDKIWIQRDGTEEGIAAIA